MVARLAENLSSNRIQFGPVWDEGDVSSEALRFGSS